MSLTLPVADAHWRTPAWGSMAVWMDACGFVAWLDVAINGRAHIKYTHPVTGLTITLFKPYSINSDYWAICRESYEVILKHLPEIEEAVTAQEVIDLCP